MRFQDFLESYPRHVRRLRRWLPRRFAMARAVGGHYDAVGALEFYLLVQLGLQPEHTVVDVGCGSGRLAVKLRDYLSGPYLGTDVVAELAAYAAEQCARHDWRFEITNGASIPQRAGSADFVCFFSVFTHLLHADSYRYLAEAKRVAKPGGTIVFSFLEFSVAAHWKAFSDTLSGRRAGGVLNQFVSRDAIAAWADHLGLSIEHVFSGDSNFIELPEPVRFDDGRVLTGSGSIGQSVCVLRAPGR